MVEPEEKEEAPSAVGEAGAAVQYRFVQKSLVSCHVCACLVVCMCVCSEYMFVYAFGIIATKRDLTCIRICSTSNRNVMLALKFLVWLKRNSVSSTS